MSIRRIITLFTLIGMGFGVSSSFAKMVQKNQDTVERDTFNDVSKTDLINQKQPTLKSHVRSPEGAFGDNTNDGEAKLGSAEDGEYWSHTQQPNTLTYSLNTSDHTGGYDIQKIVLLTGWSNAEASQANLDFELLVSKVGSSEFSSLGTYKHTPYDDTRGGVYAVRMTLTDDSGPIASGVDEIRFIFKAASHEGQHPGLVIREIDVEGNPSE